MDPTLQQGLSSPMTMGPRPTAAPGQPMTTQPQMLTPQVNDARNQIAAAMAAQTLNQQTMGGAAAMQANPYGINQMAPAQMPFQSNVMGA